MEENNNVVTTPKEGSKFGWGVLGFFFPVVGLILFLVWLKNKKKASKAAGIGALIGFILSIILTVGFFVGFLGLFDSLFGYKSLSDGKCDLEKLDLDDPDCYGGCTTGSIKVSDLAKTGGTTLDSKIREKYGYSIVNFKTACKVYTTVTYDKNGKQTEAFTIYYNADNSKTLRFPNGGSYKMSKYDDIKEIAEYYVIKNNIIIKNIQWGTSNANIYINNSGKNKGFKLKTDYFDGMPSKFSDIEVDDNDNLIVTTSLYTASGFEGMRDDPRVKVLMAVVSKTTTDIDATLKEYGVDNFAFTKKLTYKLDKNGNYEETPTVETVKTIKDFYNENMNTSTGSSNGECSVVATKKNSSTSTNEYQKEDEEKSGYTASIDSNCKKINVLSSSNKKLFTIDVESENMKWVTIGDHKYCIFNAKSIDFCDYDYAGYIIVEGAGTAPGDGWVDIYNPDTGALTVVNYDAIKSETYDVPMIIDGFHVMDGAIHIYMKIDPNFDRATEEPAKSKLEFVKKIKEKKITDIDQALKDSGYDNFAFSIEVNYKRPGEEPISIVTTKTIKDYFEEINR